MDDLSKQALLADLWEFVCKAFRDPGQNAGRDKSEIAFEALNLFAKADELERDVEGCGAVLDDGSRLAASVNAYTVWQLFSLEKAGWALHEIARLEAVLQSDASSRLKIKSILQSQSDAQWPSHGIAIDPMPLFMPRALVVELLEAVDALERGEALPLFKPIPTGRHDASWNWDVMRTRALQYVEFYRGQGLTKKKAQNLVALATGASPNTLRAWETDIHPTEPLEPAFQAGRIKQMREVDPNYGMKSGETIDAHGLHYLQHQLAQPLSEFGRDYQDRFGRRHNQVRGDGD